MSLLIPGTNSIKDTGYDVANSVRLNRADSANFTRTPSSASNRRTWTWSGWVKRSGLGNIQTLFDGSDGGYPEIFYFAADDTFIYQHDISGSDYKLISSQVFKDTSAWMHIVVAKDTTQSTETNRLKVYVNGSQITMNESALGYPPENYEGAININDIHIIGNWKTNSYYIDGYLAEVAFVDGSQLDATSFGQFNSDSPTIWQPKDISGLTFGTNGFHLDFEDSSALGNDVSGNNNDYTPNNLAAIDQCTDTCTNNFATFTAENHTYSNFTVTEGNLKTHASSGQLGLHGTSIMPTNSGKWYFEVKINTAAPGDGSRVGIMNYQTQLNNSSYSGTINTPQQVLAGCTTSCKSAKHFEGDAQGVMVEYTSSGDFADGNIVQFAMDLDNKAIYIGRDGTFLTRTGSSGGDPTSGSSKTGAITTNTNIMDGSPMTAYTGLSKPTGSADSEMLFNFGNPPFSITSGNTDANGFGNFEHAPPAGYLSWCSKNLAESG